MAFPLLYDSATSVETGNTSTHTVALPPTVVSGQLLIVMMAFDGNPTVTWDNSSHGTWTSYIDTANGTACKFVVRAKISDGTEGGGSLTITIGAASEQSVHRSMAIQSWEGTLAGGLNIPAAATGTTANPDPPAATDSWGTVDRKTISAFGNDFSRTVTVYPSGYTLNQFNDISGGGQGCGLGAAGRNANEGSQNPGQFTIDSSDQWVAATISVLGGTAGNPVVDDPPPRSRARLATILAAWTVAPVLIWQNGLSIPETVAAEKPAYSRAWLPTVREAWEPPPEIRQARRFAPQAVAAPAAQPSTKRVWLSTVNDSWVIQDTPRQAINKQVVSVDNPPRRPRLQESVKAAWQPDTWDAQKARSTGQEFVVEAERVPFGRKWLGNALDSWAPEGWAAQTARHYPQGFVAPQINQPYKRQWLKDVIASWETDPSATQPRRLVPQAVAAPADDPPISNRPWFKTALESWTPQQIVVWQNGYYVESVAQVDDPTPLSRAWTRTVLRAWEPEPWAVQALRRVTEGGAAPVEKTPFSRKWVYGAVASWHDDLVPLWVLSGTPEEAAAPADNPPFGKRSWLQGVSAWKQETWEAQTAAKTPQEAAAPAPDQPYARAWLKNVIASWEPDPSTPKARRLAPQVSAPADNPPLLEREWLLRITAAWEAPANPAQAVRYVVQGTPSQVDDPPFGKRSWMPTVLRTWEPPPPQPEQLVRTVTEEGVAPPVVVDEVVKTGTGGIDPGDAKRRRIIKPTGILHLPKKDGRKDVQDRVDESRELQAEVSAKIAGEFLEQTVDKQSEQVSRKDIAQMSMLEIDAEIGALLRKKIRTEDEDILLLLLLVAGGE